MNINDLFSGKRSKISEVTLGDYRKKAQMQQAMAKMDQVFGSPEQKEKAIAVDAKRTAGLDRLKTRDAKRAEIANAKAKADALAQTRANLPALKAQLEKLEAELDTSYEYSDDHSVWSRNKAIADRIAGLKQSIANASEQGVAEGAGNGYYYLQGGIERSKKFESAEEAKKQVVAFGNEARVSKVTLRFKAPGAPAQPVKTFSINNEQDVAEGVATTIPELDAKNYLRKYGADHFQTTTNELHFYKNGRPFSVDLVLNPDTSRSVTISSLNAARRGLTGQGVTEGEEMSTFAALKDWRVWDVTIMNNYYRGKYADYGARPYSVVASSPEEARQVVINNADYVLQDLLSRKLVNGKKVLPRGSALPVEEKRVGDAKPGSITTMAFKKMLTPDGVQSFKFTNGKIVDGAHVQGGEEVEEDGWDEWEKDYDERMNSERAIWNRVFGGPHEKTAPDFKQYPRYDDSNGPVFGDGKKKQQGVAEGIVGGFQVGDPVIITGDVNYNGKTGEIAQLGREGAFVVVDLYNYGKHSFHSSDVSMNEYAGSDDEEARMYDAGEFNDELDEHIRKLPNGKYRLLSKKGNKNLGTFDSKAGAEKHEREVQYFKHANEDTEQLSELSNELLAAYKKASGISARELDKAGKYKQADKRFHGIVQATKKEFANDLKKHKQDEDMAGIPQDDTTSPIHEDIAIRLSSMKRAGYDL